MARPQHCPIDGGFLTTAGVCRKCGHRVGRPAPSPAKPAKAAPIAKPAIAKPVDFDDSKCYRLVLARKLRPGDTVFTPATGEALRETPDGPVFLHGLGSGRYFRVVANDGAEVSYRDSSGELRSQAIPPRQKVYRVTDHDPTVEPVIDLDAPLDDAAWRQAAERSAGEATAPPADDAEKFFRDHFKVIVIGR